MSFSAENLTCKRGERLLFHELNFTLEPGEALILRGRNGAGKSSLLRMASGFLPPFRGRFCWNERDVAEDMESHRQRLNYVGHLDGVKTALTVTENLKNWAKILGGGGDVEAEVMGALEAFGIQHLADAPVRHLSAGQKKRTALARLLLRKAPLWLLDEATVSLDQDGVERLSSQVAAHRAAGGMVIAATHIELGLEQTRTLEITRPTRQTGWQEDADD